MVKTNTKQTQERRNYKILSRQVVPSSLLLIKSQQDVALTISDALLSDGVFTTGELYDAEHRNSLLPTIKLSENTKRTAFAGMSYIELLNVLTTCIHNNMFIETEKSRQTILHLLCNMMNNRSLEEACQLLQNYSDKSTHDLLNNDRNVKNKVKQIVAEHISVDPIHTMSMFENINATAVAEYCNQHDQLLTDAETCRLILFKRLEYMRQRRTQLRIMYKKQSHIVYLSEFVDVISLRFTTIEDYGKKPKKWLFYYKNNTISHPTAKVIIPDNIEHYYCTFDFLPDNISNIIVGYVTL